MDLTGDIPLGLYEAPVPKVRWVHSDISLGYQNTYTHTLHLYSLPSHTYTLHTHTLPPPLHTTLSSHSPFFPYPPLLLTSPSSSHSPPHTLPSSIPSSHLPSSPLQCRSLTPEMMTWVARSGRFVFHKDTSLDLQTMVKKINAVKAVPDTPLM